MPAGKNQSDQDLLFDVELLTVQQVAKWARVSPSPFIAESSQEKYQSLSLGNVLIAFLPEPSSHN